VLAELEGLVERGEGLLPLLMMACELGIEIDYTKGE